jgi:hypothetical protein
MVVLVVRKLSEICDSSVVILLTGIVVDYLICCYDMFQFIYETKCQVFLNFTNIY